jgi:hypothetical protein
MWCRTRWQAIPPELNTRRIVEVPALFVCGLFQDSELPTLLGLAAFSRAILANRSWLSSGDSPRPEYLPKGMTWACAATASKRQTAIAAGKERGDQDLMGLSSTPRALTPPPCYFPAQKAGFCAAVKSLPRITEVHAI